MGHRMTRKKQRERETGSRREKSVEQRSRERTWRDFTLPLALEGRGAKVMEYMRTKMVRYKVPRNWQP